MVTTVEEFAPVIVDWSTKYPGMSEGAMNSVKGLVVHHTGGRGVPSSVAAVLLNRGYGVQYIMDRDGTVYRVAQPGVKVQHFKPGEGPGAGFSNVNTEGIEIIANDDTDLTPAQVESFTKFAFWHSTVNGYDPTKAIFGHGEVNFTGKYAKQPTEGMTAKNAFEAAYPELEKEWTAGGFNFAPGYPAGPSSILTADGGSALAAINSVFGTEPDYWALSYAVPKPLVPLPRARPRYSLLGLPAPAPLADGVVASSLQQLHDLRDNAVVRASAPPIGAGGPITGGDGVSPLDPPPMAGEPASRGYGWWPSSAVDVPEMKGRGQPVVNPNWNDVFGDTPSPLSEATAARKDADLLPVTPSGPAPGKVDRLGDAAPGKTSRLRTDQSNSIATLAELRRSVYDGLGLPPEVNAADDVQILPVQRIAIPVGFAVPANLVTSNRSLVDTSIGFTWNAPKSVAEAMAGADMGHAFDQTFSKPVINGVPYKVETGGLSPEARSERAAPKPQAPAMATVKPPSGGMAGQDVYKAPAKPKSTTPSLFPGGDPANVLREAAARRPIYQPGMVGRGLPSPGVQFITSEVANPAYTTWQKQMAAYESASKNPGYVPYTGYGDPGGLTKPPVFTGPKTITVKRQIAASPKAPITGGSYTIQAGDTLSSIARRSGVSVAELARINGIADPNKIAAGASIRTSASSKSISVAPSPATMSAALAAQRAVGARRATGSSPAPAAPAKSGTAVGSSTKTVYKIGAIYTTTTGAKKMAVAGPGGVAVFVPV